MFTSLDGHCCYLVALEGPDRVGKATQSKMLAASLREKGFRAQVAEMPFRDGATYSQIYQMLGDGSVNDEPVVFQTLQAVNRKIFQSRDLQGMARQFDVVVLDRWTMSTRVYGSASGVAPATTALILRGLVEPDVTFVLDGGPFPKNNLDVWEADDEFQQLVRSGYREACEGKEDVVVIDAKRSKEDVHSKIVAELVSREIPAPKGPRASSM